MIPYGNTSINGYTVPLPFLPFIAVAVKISLLFALYTQMTLGLLMMMGFPVMSCQQCRIIHCQ